MGPDDDSSSVIKDSAPGINIEDLSLPKSIVTRLAKAALPANTQIQSNAMLGLTKSATLFINYIASQANEIAAASNRKTVNANDVFAALEDSEFASWRSRLEAELQKHNEIIEQRKVKSKDICGTQAAKKIKRIKVNPDDNANGHENNPIESEQGENKLNGVKSSIDTEINDSKKNNEENQDESEKVVEDEEDEEDDEDEEGEAEEEEEEEEEEALATEEIEEEALAVEEIEEEEANDSDEALDNGEDSD